MKQIQLRNLSGMILIDFINFTNKSDQQLVIEEIKKVIKLDSVTTKIMGFTELGILQLTRKVTSSSLLQYSTSICPTCKGVGRVESAQAAAFRLERELLMYRNSDYRTAIIDLTNDIWQWFSGGNHWYKEKLETDSGIKMKANIIEAEKPYFTIKQLLE